MKRALLGLVLITSALACDDIDRALEARQRREDGGSGGGGGPMGGGGGSEEMDSGMPMGGGIGPLDAGGLLCPRAFCWENPRPQGNPLNAVWGASADDVWMVGESGTVLRWQDGVWRSYQESFPGDQILHSVWGTNGKVWVVGSPGGSTVMHPQRFDSADGGWHDEPFSGAGAAQLLSVRGTDESNVWAVGLGGSIAQRNPASGAWSSKLIYDTNTNLRAIAFDSTGTCRVALENGNSGVGLCDGGALELALAPTDEIDYGGLWAAAPGEFYAVGLSRMPAESRIWSRDTDGGWGSIRYGTSESCSAGFGQDSFSFAFCGSGAIVQVPGFGVIGNTGTDDSYSGAWTPGVSTGSWLVGQSGAMVRHDGVDWRNLRQGSTEAVYSLFLASDGRALAGGSNNRVFERAADTTWQTAVINGGQGGIRAIWIGADGWTVIAGSNRMLREGDSLTNLNQASNVMLGTDQIEALWGPSKDDLWAVGENGQLWHRDGIGWDRDPRFADGGPPLYGIDGTSATTAYIVGDDCTVLSRASDGGWTSEGPACSQPMFAVSAIPPDDGGLTAVAVGPSDRAYLRSDDGGWSESRFPSDFSSTLHGVWAASSRQIYAVGDDGLMLQFNGTEWSRLIPITPNHLHAVRGRRTGGGFELFVGGDYGLILRRQF